MSCGADEFKVERTRLVLENMKEVCEDLIKQNKKITASSVANKLKEQFEKKSIDSKYLVLSQSIARSEKYGPVLKQYKAKQESKSHKASRLAERKGELPDFEMVDKYNMLLQSYIEVRDTNAWLEGRVRELTNELDVIQSTERSGKHTQTVPNINSDNELNAINILKFIDDQIQDEAVVIIQPKNSDEVIVKSLRNANREQLKLTRQEWKSLFNS